MHNHLARGPAIVCVSASFPANFTDDVRSAIGRLWEIRSEVGEVVDHLEGLIAAESAQQPPVSEIHKAPGYTLFGEDFAEAKGSRILVEVLAHLAADPAFPELYQEALRNLGRKRPYVARSKHDVYPGNPYLSGYTEQFAPGWFVGTNESNRTKLKLLKIACEVSSLSWGRDLVVRMPGAPSPP